MSRISPRHPAPWRSRYHAREFRSQIWWLSSTGLIAAVLVALLFAAEALGIRYDDRPLFILIGVIAVLVLLAAYRSIRSHRKRP